MREAIIAGIVFLILLACGFGVAAFEKAKKTLDEATSIVAVFKQQGDAVDSFRSEQRTRRAQAVADFCKGVGAIDTSHCPQDFRLAWFDYVSALQVAAKGNRKGVADLMVGLVALATGAEHVAIGEAGKALKAQKEYQGSLEAVPEAFRRCQRVAIEHDVVFH